jgi:hypothetical protein
MAEAVVRRSLTGEACVRSQISPCEVICNRQSNSGAKFSPSTSVSSYQYRSTNVRTNFHLHVTLTRPAGGRQLGILKKVAQLWK